MKQKPYLLTALLCLSLIKGYSQTSPYTSLMGEFGQPKQLISELTDVFYSATSRFGVTPNVPGLFNGDINDAVWGVAAGTSSNITIDLMAKGEIGPAGLTYPEGYIYVSFYSTSAAASVSGQLQYADGSWVAMDNFINISPQAAAGYAVFQGQVGSRNWLKAIQLTVTAAAGYSASVAKIEYHRWRSDYELLPNIVSKYWTNKFYAPILFQDGSNTSQAFITADGKGFLSGSLGVGTATPAAQLHTTGSVRFAGLGNDNTQSRVVVSDAGGNLSYRDIATLSAALPAGWNFGGNTVGTLKTIGTVDNNDLPFITNNTEQMRITAGGNVGIGISNPTARLGVNGDVMAKKVKVTPNGWPDYVFDSAYKLPALEEVEHYIKANKHLPDMVSATQVQQESLDLGESQAAQLKKIEELTLYMIELNRKIETLTEENRQLKKMISRAIKTK